MDPTQTGGGGEEQPLRRDPKHRHRVEIVEDILRSMPRGRMLDMATGHGKFALAGHRLGYQVTAMDARTERMPRTTGIEWVQGDVRDFPTAGYDVITILGLLYHLDLADQIGLLRRCLDSVVVADTHISFEPNSVEAGYLGHYYQERGGLASSWGNPTAFWPTEDSLFRMFGAAGYGAVAKVLPFPVRHDRTFYVLSRSDDADFERLVASFNGRSAFTLELQRALRGVGDNEHARLAGERDAAVAKLDRLRSRKSVNIALRVASITAPVVRRVRARRH